MIVGEEEGRKIFESFGWVVFLICGVRRKTVTSEHCLPFLLLNLKMVLKTQKDSVRKNTLKNLCICLCLPAKRMEKFKEGF